MYEINVLFQMKDGKTADFSKDILISKYVEKDVESNE